MPDVMTNQFGNYLVQRLIEVAPVYALKQLIPAVTPVMVEVAIDMHGTRTIQTLVEMAGKHPKELHNELLLMGNEMSRYIVDLILDPHGNHCVQELILAFKASNIPEELDTPGAEAGVQYTQFIYNACMA